MKLLSRPGRLGAAVAAVALAASAMALGASGDARASVLGPDGDIVCNGDLCIQTNSVDTTACTAVVAAWADTSSFFGHFEMAIPSTGYVANSNTQTWPAGGQNYRFQVHFNPNVTYEATAWGFNGGQYQDLGRVDFTINDASGC